MANEHAKLKGKELDDTLDLSVHGSHGKRFSIDTINSDVLSEHPKSQSSPTTTKSDSSANSSRNIDSFDMYDTTQSNIEELCKTKCNFTKVWFFY